MKVECIDDNVWVKKPKKYLFGLIARVQKTKGPKKGEILTVVDHRWEDGDKYYLFVEWPGGSAYNSIHFKPLTEQFDKSWI